MSLRKKNYQEPVPDKVVIIEETQKTNKNNSLHMTIERCYAINENTFGCVEVELDTKKGLKYISNTNDLIPKDQLPDSLVCKNILQSSVGSVQNASICSNTQYNDADASHMFKNFIPIILNKIE